ncbi:MAG: NAD(P)/FAD-dependent oxidoreductase [Cardiobacteriaceae bacterium]|nr:NAD(P)/FAD-dependent oxidoreductase [Cardiobacteriaceae bacterium]
MKKIVILGGGFAGVNLARIMGKQAAYSITLVDQNNYNFFPPLIYQIAAGFMSPSDISYPFRKLFNKKKNIRFRQGRVTRIDPVEKRVFLEHGSVDYDVLVIALGSQPNYFGNTDLAQHAYTMKSISDALAIRNNILAQLEEACNVEKSERDPYLHLVVAGGGASGVELTGILAEMRRDIFSKDYPELAGDHGHLTLVTADPVLLPPMREVSQRYTEEALKKLGVDIICSDPVTAYDGNTIVLQSGKTIAAKSLIWTAGVTAVKLDGIPVDCYGRGSRLKVDRQLRVQGLDDVYAMGDCALVEGDPDYPNGHPQLGQVAMAQGKYLGKYFGQSDKPFVYKHRGDMAMIGRLSAVADMPSGRSIQGVIAWFLWVIVHILALVTFKNRVAATYDWSIAFLTKNQAMRMNIQPSPPKGRRNT